jgi:hypothetical protein
MAFLRKQTSEGSIALLYSIIQKCMRRGLEGECLYYSDILFKEGTPNSLRKRLVYVTNEDIGHIELSNEIVECKDEDLYKYVVICCRLKKTHDPAWLSRLALHYSMNNLKTDNPELIESMKMTEYVRDDDYKSIRKYIGKKYCKLYSFSGKNNLVWALYIMYKRRPELNQEYTLDIKLPEKKRFDEIPFWVKDKHVSGGNKGYKFFFDNSLVVNENIYEGGDRYAEECKKVYLDDEENMGNGKTKVVYKIWKEGAKDIYEKIIPGYKDVVQIQLITSRGKPQVYFATSVNDNKKYVLKGPIHNDMRKQIMRTENIKKRLGLNQLNVDFININDQIWMISDSILDYDKDKKELKSSKLEENVYIYNGDNCNLSFDMIETHFMNIYKQYLLRLVVGANDHSARNFIHKGDVVYSVDDHSLEEEVGLIELKACKKVLKELWDKKVIENKKNILEILFDWFDKLEDKGLSKTRIRISKLFILIYKL